MIRKMTDKMLQSETVPVLVTSKDQICSDTCQCLRSSETLEAARPGPRLSLALSLMRSKQLTDLHMPQGESCPGARLL